jgi:DeoR family transcriptional regulator, glycerol-3-phosphate regulon repressor
MVAVLETRRGAILAEAREKGVVRVDELARRFAVSVQTIRKDLNDLCGQKRLVRVHGGAAPASGTQNMDYDRRREIAPDQKAAIGRAAAALIPDGASLFINIGTTTEAVSAELVRHRKLMVITNNINVANRLRVHAQFEVIIASGVVRPSDGGIAARRPVISFASSGLILRSSAHRPSRATARCSTLTIAK